MKWGKIGGLALFCIAFALAGACAASAAINIAVNSSVGREQIGIRYARINWSASDAMPGFNIRCSN